MYICGWHSNIEAAIIASNRTGLAFKGHFTHKTQGMWPLHFKHSHWWKRQSTSKFASHYAWGTNGLMWMQDGCKVYMDSYMASTWLYFMVTWIVLKNHLLELDLTQNRETMALQILTIVDFLYSVMFEEPAWIGICWNSIWLKAWSRMTSHNTWGPMTTLHGLGSVMEWPLDTSFGLSQFHGYIFWLMCEVALNGICLGPNQNVSTLMWCRITLCHMWTILIEGLGLILY